MVDTDDVQGYEPKFRNQRTKLERADIPEADRDAIDSWVIHLRASDPEVDSLGTVVGHLNRIRLASERARTPLTEMDGVEDVNAFKLRLKDGYDLSEGTIRNYMKAVRKFLIWQGHDWAHAITVGAAIERKHDPDEEIDGDELDAMLEAAGNPRDRALIATLHDTGLRIGAVLSFQMRHVDFESKRGTLTINPDANVKGADGPKPVTWSRGHIANWIDDHPRPNVDHAALFHKLRQWDDEDDGALRQQYAGRIVSEIAAAAGLDDDRICAHLFRGTAISQWIRDESMNDQKIKHRADWSEDSRMLGVYSRVTDEEMNDAIFDDYEIGEADADDPAGPVLEECPLCDATLRGGEDFCPSCAAPLDSTASEKLDAFESRVREFMISADDADDRAFAARAAERADSDPQFARLLAEHLADRE